MIDYADFFPFWRDLDGPQRDTLRNAITLRHVSKGLSCTTARRIAWAYFLC